ncbi:hypothetical protein [Actinophytocola sediminis]
MTLPLFDIDLRWHGTSVGLARHELAGEELCWACREWRDELVAAGVVVQLAVSE